MFWALLAQRINFFPTGGRLRLIAQPIITTMLLLLGFL
jgi:hypothetical protein